ncbi:unnamed protein product [Rotaria magnacalcarata]|uniref:AAA+ ATPase domain-containing protein n=2 Tax=Rotaria magnacalcarata TaxID=392030 RepID=A0A8S2NPI8_9BILA|nr:unnamed protein product [Rotaria magnacalcarata]
MSCAAIQIATANPTNIWICAILDKKRSNQTSCAFIVNEPGLIMILNIRFGNIIDINLPIIHEINTSVGKTTLLRRVCELYLQQSHHLPCYGFYTEEVRDNNGSRIGFDIITLDGNSRASLARINEYTTSQSSSLPRVGQYNVFVNEFERIALSLFTNLQTPCICFIDEIGKMELLSNRFKELIETLIQRRNLILIATIPIKPLGFVDRIRTRSDCRLLTVTRDNRSGPALRNELMEHIEELTKNIL